MAKDKRVKACPNPECTCNKHISKNKYQASDMFCKKCGTELVYVCSKCFKKIEDLGPDHVICAQCEAQAQDRKDVVWDYAKKAGGVVLGAGAIVINAAKSEGMKELAKAGKAIAKKGIEIAKDQIKL